MKIQDMTDGELIDLLIRGRGMSESDSVLRREFSEEFLNKLREGDIPTYLSCGCKYGPVFRELLRLRSERKNQVV
jgi:hypothetical protein